MKQKHPPGLDECLAASGGTKALITGSGVYREIPGLLKTEYGSRRVFLIADENTLRAAGSELEQILSTEKIEVAGRYIFPAEPRLHAEYCHIETLKNAIAACVPAAYSGDCAQPLVPLAIGAGTINDLVKLAAAEISLPYLCIPTAASVDGFTSYGSAILKDNFKQTLPCDAPRCVVADTGVLSRAPEWLSSSGFADLAGKISAGADWIIADAAAPFGAKGADRIESAAWAMVQYGLYDYLDRSVTAAQGDQAALGSLFEALSITGFAMQYIKNSRPVSGAEHLFAHVWEMDDISRNGNPVTHGHKVAIGSLAAAAFLETLFADPNGPPPLSAAYRCPTLDDQIAEARAAFGTTAHAASPALDSVIKTCVEKYHDEKNQAKIREGILDTWKELRAKVLEQIMPYTGLRAMFAKARCPILPEEIGLSRSAVIACARRGRMIRNRYSELDLAWDMGCFETVLARIEESGVYFY
ncbi:MAG: iron-containing alcohol dehydrogenase [Treponema sp.]|jgi:glycerol-1-phosphate dehydrogenase [NAD(P)+]|nr:iron-containing alcohol dehydrogenase [Treponema sp.]